MPISDYKVTLQEAVRALEQAENLVFTAMVNVGFAGEYSDISNLHEVGEILNLEVSMFERTNDQNLQLLTQIVKEINSAKERIISLNGLDIDCGY